MQLTGVEGLCSGVVGRCDKRDCESHCDSFSARVSGWSCSYNNLCTCWFDTNEPPPGSGLASCDIGLGLCDNSCDESCCKSKCSRTYSRGIGRCIDAFDMSLCLCSYNG